MTDNIKNNASPGFTLIELSIVILVIGLIVGGIAAGSSAIKQSQLRAVISEVNQFQAAIVSFKLQYSQFPGDFNNASSFWSSSNCTAGITPGGCNGNGDGHIDNQSLVNGDEMYRAWQHLQLSGNLIGTYDGTQGNYPISKYPGGGYSIRYSAAFQTMIYANLIEFGACTSCACSSILTPLDTYNMDIKMDDGIANAGNFYGYDGGNAASGACSYPYTSTNGVAAYNSATTSPACRVNIKLTGSGS